MERGVERVTPWIVITLMHFNEDFAIVRFRNCTRGGLMVSALDFGASAPGSSPGRGHRVVFLSQTLYSHGASLHPGV